jgi:hypothetical protein
MMNIIKYVLFIAALSLPVTNTHALEWVDYDGSIPDNAVSVNEGTEDRPICRNNERIGVVNDSGRCRSVKIGSGVSKKDDFQILVDNSENASSVSTDDAWSYDSQRGAILSVCGQSYPVDDYSECMSHYFRSRHINFLDEDSTPVTMYDIAVANNLVFSATDNYPGEPVDHGAGPVISYSAQAWIEHLIEAGVHPQLAVLIQRFGNRYWERGGSGL